MKPINEFVGKVINADCLEVMKEIPDKSIDTIITSPPYWSLRDYEIEDKIWDGDENCEHNWNERIKKGISGGANKKVAIKGKENYSEFKDSKYFFCSKCGAWKGQLGLEPTFDLFIKHLCDIFDEVKRVLKKTGNCWVNLGDTYYGGGGWSGIPEDWDSISSRSKQKRFTPVWQIKNVEHQLPNKCLCMIPQRFAIEMINRGWRLRNTIIWHKPNCMPQSHKDRFTVDFEYLYFFTKSGKYWFEQQFEEWTDKIEKKGSFAFQKSKTVGDPFQGRIKRSVWSINLQPYPDSHFACFPEELIEIPIRAGCPEKGIVLDPFAGSGTVGVVAKKLNRNYILIDISEKYCKLAERRLKGWQITVPKEIRGLNEFK